MFESASAEDGHPTHDAKVVGVDLVGQVAELDLL
jgi:hypothetical protein